MAKNLRPTLNWYKLILTEISVTYKFGDGGLDSVQTAVFRTYTCLIQSNWILKPMLQQLDLVF